MKARAKLVTNLSKYIDLPQIMAEVTGKPKNTDEDNTEPRSYNSKPRKQKAYKEIQYSVCVDKSWMPKDYDKYVKQDLLDIKFIPDVFQKQAFYFLSRQESVFISAHTSAGKTLVAEYAIALAEMLGGRTIYTSPIKALSNQKFYDFKQKFKDVGIITGDVQVNPLANCLIMTTEILRNLIYKSNDILQNTKYVVFDEVHYINDTERGVVWEECIIMLPKHITLILLSATIPNAKEFSDWVGRTKGRIIYIISTDKRPVPLEHLLYADREVYHISQQKKDAKVLSNFRSAILPYSKKSTPMGRFKISDLANFVIRKKLVPSIFFCFSKKKCEKYVDNLGNLDMTTISEKRDIKEFLRSALEQLPGDDRSLPQIVRMQQQANYGIAVHHGGLLPFVKECVEILFSLNLIKILIATETFAMGVNMPAKSVVFLSLNKIDGETFRNLTNGEYTQMSGRAGRRGMDKVGTVLIADEKVPSISTIERVIKGQPSSLNSQFKLSFGLILIALRSNFKVEEIMKKSFREHAKQRTEHRDMHKLKELENIERNKDSVLVDYVQNLNAIGEYNKLLLRKHRLIRQNDKVLLRNNQVGKVVIIKDDNLTLEKCDGTSDVLKLFECTSIACTQSSYLRFPHTIHLPVNKQTVQIDEVFCILEGNDIFVNYNISSATDFIVMNRLQETYKQVQCVINMPDLLSRYVAALKYVMAENEIARIKLKYSIENLDMIKEYDNRIKFLQKNNFYNDTVTLKGRVAAEINTVNEVLSTEMIFDNEFKNFDPAVIVSLLSSMIYEVETEEEPVYDKKLEDGVNRLKWHFNKLSKDVNDLLIPPFKDLNFSLIQAVFDWCNKEKLQTVVTTYNVSEGEFVRLILRLDECCKEMINACILIEDKELESKFAEASELLKRDIIFLPSLYL